MKDIDSFKQVLVLVVLSLSLIGFMISGNEQLTRDIVIAFIAIISNNTIVKEK